METLRFQGLARWENQSPGLFIQMIHDELNRAEMKSNHQLLFKPHDNLALIGMILNTKRFILWE